MILPSSYPISVYMKNKSTLAMSDLESRYPSICTSISSPKKTSLSMSNRGLILQSFRSQRTIHLQLAFPKENKFWKGGTTNAVLGTFFFCRTKCICLFMWSERGPCSLLIFRFREAVPFESLKPELPAWIALTGHPSTQSSLCPTVHTVGLDYRLAQCSRYVVVY